MYALTSVYDKTDYSNSVTTKLTYTPKLYNKTKQSRASSF